MNVAPSVAADNASVTVNEASAAGNTGTYGDVGADTVSLAASIGTVTDNGNGTWTWSYTPADGPDDSQTVTITATDSDEAQTTTTFDLTVVNVAPSVAADNASVTVNEASAAGNTGTYGDMGADTVSLAASVGTITDNGNGAWSWSYTPADGPDESQTVTITATDSDGAATSTTFALIVENVAPTAAADNSSITVSEASAASNTGTYGEVGNDTVSLAASIGTITDNGNGTWSWSYTPTDGPDESQTVTITATDSDGAETTTSFELTVVNVAPSVAVDNASVTVNEATAAGNTGTYGDVGNDTVSLAASVGTITDNGNGTWSWSYTPADGPDESQTVMITATDSDGAETTTSFDLTVLNVPPSVAADNSSVTVTEASSAANTGTYGDVGNDTVSLAASIGTITDNGNGTWSWSYTPADGPDESQTVTTTATDSDGAQTTTTFDLTVVNVAPSVAADNASVSVNEASAASNTGTYGDVGNDTVILAASVGAVTDNHNGTWSWSYTPADGPNESQTVIITATDSDGAQATTSFELTVVNVAPVFEAGPNESLDPPQDGVFGREGITFIDPGTDTHTVIIDWDGDLVADETIAVPFGQRTFDLNHTYTTQDTFTVTVSVDDSDPGGIYSDSFDVTVILNEPPVIEDQMFAIDENSDVGAVVGTVVAGDPDLPDDTLTWSITGGNSSGAFAIDNHTGVISVANKAAVDFETTPSFHLTVQVEDSFGETDAATITVDLNDLEATLWINDASVVEGDSATTTLGFTVSVTGDAVNLPFSVNYTTADGTAFEATSGIGSDDYEAAAGTLNFNGAADQTQPVYVTVNGDAVVEIDETLSVILSDLAGTNDVTITDDTGEGLIENDDAAEFSVSSESGNEDDGPITFSITLSNPVDVTTSVDISTSDGTALVSDADYAQVFGLTLSFAAGVTSQTFDVLPTADAKLEPDEAFSVGLSNVVTEGRSVTASAVVGTGVILNDDVPLAFTISDVTAAEGNSDTTPLTFTVTLSSASSETVTVNYATADGTATGSGNPKDYNQINNSTLTFAAGETIKTITVDVVGDTLSEDDETLYVNLSNPSNGVILDGQGLGTITNDDAPPIFISIDDVSLAEEDSGTTTFAFTVTLSSASSETITVDYVTADGTATTGGNPSDDDYLSINKGTLTFAPGETIKTITVDVLGETLSEVDETFFVDLSNAVNGVILDGQGLGTITNDDTPPIFISIDDVSLTEGNGGTKTFTFTVTLSSLSAQTITVDYATADGTATGGNKKDYKRINRGTLTFAPGVTSQTIDVLVNGDTTAEANETFFVDLSNAVNAIIEDDQGLGTILDDESALRTDEASHGKLLVQRLDVSQVQPLLSEAIKRWDAVGANTVVLATAEIQIAPLPGRIVGRMAGNAIFIDPTASGHGWFIDPSPRGDSEFEMPGDQGELYRLDLLTVITHEAGHLMGLEHAAGADDLMSAWLSPGERPTIHGPANQGPLHNPAGLPDFSRLTGSDRLYGDGGLDLSIADDGSDTLKGGKGDDLLIPCLAENEDHLSALDAEMADWATGELAAALDDLGNLIDDGDTGELDGQFGSDELFVESAT